MEIISYSCKRKNNFRNKEMLSQSKTNLKNTEMCSLSKNNFKNKNIDPLKYLFLYTIGFFFFNKIKRIKIKFIFLI